MHTIGSKMIIPAKPQKVVASPFLPSANLIIIKPDTAISEVTAIRMGDI